MKYTSSRSQPHKIRLRESFWGVVSEHLSLISLAMINLMGVATIQVEKVSLLCFSPQLPWGAVREPGVSTTPEISKESRLE